MPSLRQWLRRSTKQASKTPFTNSIAGYLIRRGMVFPIKSTGSPLLDAFMGIDDDSTEFANTPDGLAKAYAASVLAYRCIRILAQTVASIPLNIMTLDNQPLINHPLQRTLCTGRKRLIRDTMSDWQIFGAAYWELSGANAIRRNAQTIERVADTDGLHGFVQRIDGAMIAEWKPRQMVYFHDYDPDDDFGGIAPLQYALTSVGITLNIQKFAERYFENDAMLSGLLSTDQPAISKADQDRMHAEWDRMYGGVENAHKTALMWNGVTYQPITPALKDLVMRELREDEGRAIAEAFGVPATIALMTDSANYATMKEQLVLFNTGTVIPWIELLTDTVTEQWLQPTWGDNIQLVADVDSIEVLQEDRTEVTSRNQIAVSTGWMSLNEARKIEKLDPLPNDYFIIGGKPITRQALEAGDLSIFEPPPAAPSPFGFSFPAAALPQQDELRALSDVKSVHVTIYNENGKSESDIIEGALVGNAERDLQRWERKALKKGPQSPFESDYIPSAVRDFVRNDLLAWDGENDRTAAIKVAFEWAVAQIKAETDDFATPEEFEAYWRGIGGLFDSLAGAFDSTWQTLPARMASAIREAGASGAAFEVDQFFASITDELANTLAGDEAAPGALSSIFLAGAARGNDLLLQQKSVKQDLSIAWDVVNKLAVEWAREYGASMVRGINDTTLAIFREKIADWIDKGGTLEDLADFIEGKLPELDIPPGWSAGKLQWATSPARARLIAQTETTNAYHEGAVARWEQAGVRRGKWRTQQDNIVRQCKICWPLNNVIGDIRTGWVHPKTGKVYRPSAHPGCRCFGAPVVE